MKTFLLRGAAFDWSVAVDDKTAGRLYPLSEYFSMCNHSPDGFSWGYNGSGPSQLAFAIVYNVTNDVEVTRKMYMRFRERVIARLDQNENHELTESQVVFALQQIALDQLTPDERAGVAGVIESAKKRLESRA